MSVSILFLLVTVTLNIIIFFIILYVHFNENRKKKIKNKKRKEYAEDINECIWDLGKCSFKKKKIDIYFIDSIIFNINSYAGEKREKIIEMAERAGVVEYIYQKYKKSWFETERKLYIYFMGEIRSLNKFDELLKTEITEVVNQNVLFEYYFAICRIFKQQYENINKEIKEKFEEKLFEIFKAIDETDEYEIEKFCNLIILEGILRYHEEESNILEKFFLRIMESDISLKSKGEVIYLCALRQVKGIKRYISNKSKELLKQEIRDRAEDELLIKLIKSYGEFRIKQGEYVITEAAKDREWNVRATAVKYIEKIEGNEKLFMKLLGDENWWVRNNTAENLINKGKNGERLLINALKGEDRFARESSAYRLSSGEFGIKILRYIFEGNLDKILDRIEALVNEGNNMNVLDIILKENLVSVEDKIKVIKVVKNPKFLDYYENSIQRKDYDERIDKTAKLKLEEIFRKAVIE